MNLDILNMKEAVQRAAENGIHLSEYTLRRAIRSGQLPCRIVGRTYLIAWENVVRWLNCVDGSDTYHGTYPAHLSKNLPCPTMSMGDSFLERSVPYGIY